MSTPAGDSFDIDYVSHEVGHQFGGEHTMSGVGGYCGANAGAAAYEPGSGSTIQAYAGICGDDNLQDNSDPYFHAKSLSQFNAERLNHIVTECVTPEAHSNKLPVVSVLDSMDVPKNTGFILSPISATDENDGQLYYTWEQYDLSSRTDQTLLNPDLVNGPIFRSYNPTEEPTRALPTYGGLISGTLNKGEFMPSVARELNFVLTVRDRQDYATTSGGHTMVTTKVNIVDKAAFAFTSIPSTMNAGAYTVTWSLGKTKTEMNHDTVQYIPSHACMNALRCRSSV